MKRRNHKVHKEVNTKSTEIALCSLCKNFVAFVVK